ncbi:MAG: tRNA (guanine(37)-N(1))-methyltransferase [Acidimicrobiales bacterium]
MRPLRIDVLTIFPEVIESYCDASILGRARRSKSVEIRVHDIRSAACDPHRSVDDSPFGGGAGMVLAPGPIFAAVEAAGPPRPLFLLSPGGRPFDQAMAAGFAAGRALEAAASPGRPAGEPASEDGALGGAQDGALGGAQDGAFSLLCGRYEGVDQRVADHLVDAELSIGDVVLAGGELAALVVIEAVVRLLPGVLGNDASPVDESFVDGLLEYPQYTRPADFRGMGTPEVLLSGDHEAVARWRRGQSLARTMRLRPDLIDRRGGLSDEERRLLGETCGPDEGTDGARAGGGG